MKLVITKSKHSEHLYISKSFRNGNKTSTRTVCKLGTMVELLPLHNNSRDEVVFWAKEQAKQLTEKEKNDSLDISLKLSSSKKIDFDKSNIFNFGYLFLQDIFYDLGIHKICKDITIKHRFEVNLTDIVSKLIYSRILSPSSKLSSYEYAKYLVEQPDFDIHHVYRALDILEEESDFIQSELYKNSTKVIKRNTSVLYYDCSNFFFESEEANGIKQYGKSKEHRPNPIVQMGVFMDGNGLPLSFVIYPGNESEQPTLIPLEKKIIKDFQLSKFIVCTDAGLASQANREFNNKGHRSYIVTQSLKKLKGHLKKWALDPKGWKLNGSDKEYNIDAIDDKQHFNNIFYKEKWIHENGLEQRLIISYSLKYKNYQREVRSGQIERAEKLVKANKSVSHKNPNSASRFIKDVKTTSQGEIAKETHLSLDIEIISEEMKYDGFYGVCTTLNDDIETIISINKRRWEIEESFRIMKTEFKSRPIYLQTDERIKAHFLTCFLSLFIYRILEKKLDEKYTTREIISTLQNMKIKHYEGYGYIPVYTRTEITDKLEEISGLEMSTEIISNKKLKKILKQSKVQNITTF